MARYSFRLPDIGEGIAEAEIVAWHVGIGDRIEEDQQLADMMTDKATIEMESPVSGVITELAGEVGEQIAIGSTLAVIETDDDSASAKSDSKASNTDSIATESPISDSPVPASSPLVSSAISSRSAPSSRVVESSRSSAVLASPAVRARAHDLGVDLSQVKAASERIRHADLDSFLRYGSGQGYDAALADRTRSDEQIKVVGMRRRIAENMAASKRTIPHFSYVEEINVTDLEEMRTNLNANRGERVRLTFLPFLIIAVTRAVSHFPMMNARYDDDAGIVTRHGAVHLGVATQTNAGLMVPVIRDAQNRNVWQLASEISRLANAAREGKAKSADLSGSTLTVTSLGPLGGIASTPVINRPEVAIISPNRIIERPIFAGPTSASGAVVRAKLMNLSISCDHRVVDGWDAASFVQELKRLLETPVLLFVE